MPKPGLNHLSAPYTARKNVDLGISLTFMARSHWRTPSCAQSASKLYVLLLNSDTLRVNGAQIRVVEEVDEESFSGLLQRHDGLTLPPAWTVVMGHGLRDFSDLFER